jgi:hypothetical protein
MKLSRVQLFRLSLGLAIIVLISAVERPSFDVLAISLLLVSAICFGIARWAGVGLPLRILWDDADDSAETKNQIRAK